MAVRLKPLNRQVMVITGATSGIGLVTARMAAEQGARLVVASRNQSALRWLSTHIDQQGGTCIPVACDVGKEAEVRRLCETALRRFGGFDSWINNAGVSIYGRLADVPLADQRRLFETDYWGVVHGSLQAIRHLGQAGGALINVGSVVSDRAIPLQGAYSAAKMAVKGFTDALRMELEHDGAPVSVTLIKPAAIDTPYKDHAANYTGHPVKNLPPVYRPELVARAILYAATHPVRDLFVGGGARALSLMGSIAPRLTDRVLERTAFAAQTQDRANADLGTNLYGPGQDGYERSGEGTSARSFSVYTSAELHPWMTAALALGAGAAAAAAMARR